MARIALFLLTASILSGLDAAALGLAFGKINLAGQHGLIAGIGLHFIVALGAGATIFLVPRAKHQTGKFTLAGLAFLFAGLTPILGSVVASWLALVPTRSQGQLDAWPGIRIGHPLDRPGTPGSLTSPLLTQSLVHSLRRDDRPSLQAAAPRLREPLSRESLIALRALREHPDARTQLYAQGALASLAENRERQLKRLREAAGREADESSTEQAPAIDARERLATALLETADSGLVPSTETVSMIREARDLYLSLLDTTEPDDAACLLGLANSHLRLGEVEAIPELLGRLSSLPGANLQANELERHYFAIQGNWSRTAQSVRRRAEEGAPFASLTSDQPRFWLNPHRPASRLPGVALSN